MADDLGELVIVDKDGLTYVGKMNEERTDHLWILKEGLTLPHEIIVEKIKERSINYKGAIIELYKTNSKEEKIEIFPPGAIHYLK